MPWLLYSVIFGKPVPVTSVGMVCSITLLFCMLMLVFFSILAFNWKMTKGKKYLYGNPKIASFCEIFLFQEWVFVCLHSISDSWLSLFLSPTNIFNVLLNFPFNSQTMNLFIFRNSTGEHNQTRVVHKISRYFSQYMEKAPNSTFTPKNFLGHYAKHAFTLSQPEIRMLVHS